MMNARECIDLAWGLCTLGATPLRAALRHKEALRLREALALRKSHGGLGLGARSPMLWPKHHQREETRAWVALREIAWPFDGRETARRQTHQTVVESPSRGRRYGSGSRWGGGTLVSSRLGERSPMLWPKHVHDLEG